MKKVRVIIKNPLLWMFTAFAVLFVSCNSDEAIRNLSEKKGIKNYSGEDLFQSIIFADGPITKDISVLRNMNIIENINKGQVLEYRRLEREGINFIKAKYPNYFDTFKKEIISGDPQIISKAFENAINKLSPFVEKQMDSKGLSVQDMKFVYQGRSNRLKELNNPQACLFSAIAVVSVGFFAVAIYAWAAIGRWNSLSNDREAPNEQAQAAGLGERASLDKEELFKSIAENVQE